jgi:hypothetical protein
MKNTITLASGAMVVTRLLAAASIELAALTAGSSCNGRKPVIRAATASRPGWRDYATRRARARARRVRIGVADQVLQRWRGVMPPGAGGCSFRCHFAPAARACRRPGSWSQRRQGRSTTPGTCCTSATPLAGLGWLARCGAGCSSHCGSGLGRRACLRLGNPTPPNGRRRTGPDTCCTTASSAA